MSEDYLPLPTGYATIAIHAGQNPEKWTSNAVVPPISLSTTFKQIAPGKNSGFMYSRSGNPTRNVLEECIAKLEGAKHGLVLSSGMGAMVTLVNHFKSGSHILSVDDVYAGSRKYLTEAALKFGFETTFVDASNPEKFKATLKPNTKLVWLESPSNPTLKVVDIKRIADIAHKEKDVIVVVDNTFMTSYFQRPLDLGADVVMYSLTKYMNGHSDVVMGALCTNRDDLHQSFRHLQNSLGIVPSPFDCYLVNRSLKTLSLRMKQHMINGLKVAHFLESHPLVCKVIHPGLPSHPQKEIHQKQSSGCSGMLSFYMCNKQGKPATLEECTKFMQNLKVFTLAGSLGDYESLISHPSVMIHGSVPPETKKELGITDSLMRISVGLEDADELCYDLDNALKSAFESNLKVL